MNKTQILFIHGAGEGAYAADRKLAESLQEHLGADYHVHCPQMRNEDAPAYASWQAQLHEELAAITGPVLLVGHSLGGAVAIKYLAEGCIPTPLAGLFLVATPYWGEAGWEVEEYMLNPNFAANLPTGLPIFLYHNRDDEVVPFAHMVHYAAHLPQATVRAFHDGGHQFHNELSAVARDIMQLPAA